MKLASTQSRKSIATALNQARCHTLDLLAQIDEPQFFLQVHPEFSPIGWHFGHLAFIEAYWISEVLADSPLGFPLEYCRLFAADGLPKQERQNLPTVDTIEQYLGTVRSKTLEYLATAPVDCQARLWQWLVQHESQHCEIISFLWQLHQQQHGNIASLNLISDSHNVAPPESEMVRVERGEFIVGSDSIEALDNERPAHRVHLDTYWIDRHPVTCSQYSEFMLQGGYQQRQYWSESGWQWLEQNPVDRPLHWYGNWYDNTYFDWKERPVSGVCYYEAEAYANFVGKRLPTEAEWEKAALGTTLNCNRDRQIGHPTTVNTYRDRSIYGCQNMLGNVWEWTSSLFAGYPGFKAYPYHGYSAAYFDGEHRVLRGGSWASGKAVLRTSFRNWYHPSVRQIFAGFRCVSDR